MSRIRLSITLLALFLGCERGGCSGGDTREVGSRGEESEDKELPGAPEVWEEKTTEQIEEELEAAFARADERDRLVLVEFLAPWCADCREVVRVSEQEPVKTVKAERYESVYVNVGDFDQHGELIEKYAVERIATLVVLTPDGESVGRITLEPVSNDEGLSPEALALWLENPEGGLREPTP